MSSAKSITLFVRYSEMSLKYDKNKNGPRTDPWGIPRI